MNELTKSQDFMETFERFWKLFPRKSGKGAAWTFWDRMNMEERYAAIEMAEAYAEVFERASDDKRGKLWAAPAWLRDRHWEDDPRDWLLQAGVTL